MRISLIAVLGLGVQFILASEFTLSGKEESSITAQALPEETPNPDGAIPVAIAPNPYKSKPLYYETPAMYEYPSSVTTYIIAQDRDSITEEIPKIISSFKQRPGSYVRVPALALFTSDMVQNYLNTFIESYPTLLDYQISIHDFWCLTILSISLSRTQDWSRRFLVNENSTIFMALIFSTLLNEGFAEVGYTEYVHSILSRWPNRIVSLIQKSSAIYSLNVIVSLMDQVKSTSQFNDFRLEIFRKIVKTSYCLNTSYLFNIRNYDDPGPITLKLLQDLDEFGTNSKIDIVKFFIEASSNSDWTGNILSAFQAKNFRAKFMASRNVLQAFSNYFSFLIRSNSFRASKDFYNLFNFLSIVFQNTNPELLVLKDIFARNSSKMLANYDFYDLQNAASTSLSTKSEYENAHNTVESSSPKNHFNTESSHIFDPIIFAFSSENIYLSCLNPDLPPSPLTIPFLLFFSEHPEGKLREWHDIIKELLDHHQINPFEMFLMATIIKTSQKNLEIVCAKVGDLFYPYDYISNPQKWINLRAFFKNFDWQSIQAVLSTPATKPIYLIFFPDEESLYHKWIVSSNPLNWQFDSKKLESTKIEVRIGDYPNSYQLVDSIDPIFSSVYPLSLALILGNENAVVAIFKHKSLLSKEHLEQAERIASMGFSSDMFHRCKTDTNTKSCIIC